MITPEGGIVAEIPDAVTHQPMEVPFRFGPGNRDDTMVARRDVMAWAPAQQLAAEAAVAGAKDIANRGAATSAWERWLAKRGDWGFFSLSEGNTPGLRISTTNECAKVYGLCAVFSDHTIPYEGDGALIVKRLDALPAHRRPQYAARPINGGAYHLWQFQRPLLVRGTHDARIIMQSLGAELDIPNMLPMLDSKASFAPGSLIPCPQRWVDVRTRLGDSGAPQYLSESTIIAAIKKLSWNDTGCRFDLDRVLDAAAEQFGVERSLLVEGNQCTTFWMRGDDGVGILRRTGVQVLFSEGCAKSFHSWAEIFGDVVWAKLTAFDPSVVAENFVFNTANTKYLQNGGGSWFELSQRQMEGELACMGVDSRRDRETGLTETQQVESYIRLNRGVVGVIEKPYTTPGLLLTPEGRVLNKLNLQVLQPSGKVGVKLADLPMLGWFFENFTVQAEASEWLIWHLALNYQACRALAPLRSQCVFVTGPVGAGKSMLVNDIIAPLFGCTAGRPFEWMLGRTNFNADLVRTGVLVLDDEGTANLTPREWSNYQERTKQLCSQKFGRMEGKAANAVMVSGSRMLFGLCNDDNPRSSQLILEVDKSNEDKLVMMRCKSNDRWPIQGEAAQLAAIQAELPDFAQFLLDLVKGEIPAHLRPAKGETTRYPLKAYREEFIAALGSRNGDGASLRELVAWFLKQSKVWDNPEVRRRGWSGTATQLVTEMSLLTGANHLLREWSPRRLEAQLRQEVAREGSNITGRVVDHTAIYTIRHELMHENVE